MSCPRKIKILAVLFLTLSCNLWSLLASPLECAADLIPTNSAQYTHLAINTGNWGAASTWNVGTVPGNGAIVGIPSNIVVTVDGVYTNNPLTLVVVAGTLQFQVYGNSELLLGTMAIPDGGVLTMGTAAFPIPSNYLARITITATNPCVYPGFFDKGVLARGIISDGNIQMYGAAKTAYLPLAGQSALTGDTSLTLASAPSGWKVGDKIVVPATSFFRSFKLCDMTTNGYLKNEVKSIAAINGSTITLDSALIYDHSCEGVYNGQIHIANLTRNVIVQSEKFVDQSYQDLDNIAGRGHVMTCTNDASFYNAAFIGLGRTNKRQYNTDPNPTNPDSYANPRGRYSLHFHECGNRDLTEVAGVISGCVVWDTPGWGYVNHSSYVFMTNCVAYNFAGAGFVTQDGDEAGNFVRCLAIGGTGLGRFPYARTVFGDNPRMSHSDMGFHGDGFWFQGPDCRVIDNIAAACKGSGFMFWAMGRYDETTKHMTSFWRTRTATRCRNYLFDGKFVIGHVPLRQVSGNTAYACMTGVKFRFQNNIGSSAINGFPGTLFNGVVGQNVFTPGKLTNTWIWNCLNGVHCGYQDKLTIDNLHVDWVAGSSTRGGVGIDANKVTANMVYKNIYITNMTTAAYTDGTATTANFNTGNCVQGIVGKNVLGHLNFGQQFSDLPSLPHPQSQPTPPVGIPSKADGDINSTNVWAQAAPVAGDTNYWSVNGDNISMTTATETFYGQTFAIEDGGKFEPGINNAKLTCRSIILDGGTLAASNDGGVIINMNADGSNTNTLTLNDGVLRCGAGNSTRNVVFTNCSVAGTGFIDITCGSTTPAGSKIDFGSLGGDKMTNFTGTFSMHDAGMLRLPAITTNNVSFELEVKGTGHFYNDSSVAVKALNIDGTNILRGTYVWANFDANQQTFIKNNGGTIIVTEDPPQ